MLCMIPVNKLLLLLLLLLHMKHFFNLVLEGGGIPHNIYIADTNNGDPFIFGGISPHLGFARTSHHPINLENS